MSSVGVLPSDCAVVNHMLNAQLVLQPHPYVAERKACLNCRKCFNLTKHTTWKEWLPWQTWYQIICLTENKELKNNYCPYTQDVTHSHTHSPTQSNPATSQMFDSCPVELDYFYLKVMS